MGIICILTNQRAEWCAWVQGRRSVFRNIRLCARSAPQNWKLCMFSSIFMLNLMVFQGLAVLFKPILLHYIIINFSSKLSKLLGGKTICLPPPQYFHWGRLPPPPPPPGSTPEWLLTQINFGLFPPYTSLFSRRCFRIKIFPIITCI